MIKHLYLKGLIPKEIKAELDEVHGTFAPVQSVFNFSRKIGCEKNLARWVPRLHNVQMHTCALSKAKIMELNFKLLQHPPYTLDLAPSDFFLFPNLKKWLGGQRFTSNEVIAQIDAHFEDLPKSYFLDGLKKLEKRLEKCIELKGDYVEKYFKICTK